tara:strand:+ start:524 stop:934 length:411 start_codon:yes stop_codon:yes gene_type:complete
MTNFKKTSGFKMSGYSYPGESPMKGKRKQADQLAAKEGQVEAMAKMEEFGEMKMESTDMLAKNSFKVNQSPLPFVAEALAEGVKQSLGQTLVKEAGKAIVVKSVSAGINAIGKKKEKAKRKAADQSGFAGIQFGKK